MKKRIVAIIVLLVVSLGSLVLFTKKTIAPAHTDDKSQNTTTVNQVTPPPQQQPTFDKTKYSTTSASSLWWIVNKQFAAGDTYVPPDLITPTIPIRSSAGADERKVRTEVAAALEKMAAAAKTEGANLMLASGYRSYQTQTAVYNNEVKVYGQVQADRESARPGHSEHQTGLSADLEDAARQCEVANCFGDLPEGKWLAANGYKYGFIIRYPQGKEAITGYRYEPWHVRYVGVDLATEMYTQKVETLEEFFGVKG